MLVVDKDHHGGRADEHGRQSAHEDCSHRAEATGSRESLDELVCARTALAVGSQRLARGLQLVNAALVAQAVGQHVEHDAAGKGEHKVHLAHAARIHGQCLAKQGQVHLDPAYERIVGYGVRLVGVAGVVLDHKLARVWADIHHTMHHDRVVAVEGGEVVDLDFLGLEGFDVDGAVCGHVGLHGAADDVKDLVARQLRRGDGQEDDKHQKDEEDAHNVAKPRKVLVPSALFALACSLRSCGHRFPLWSRAEGLCSRHLTALHMIAKGWEVL